MRILSLKLLLFLGLLPFTIHAQKWPFELWHEGKIVLTEGDTLRGFVKYDLQQDLVQYSLDDKRVEAFTAKRILFFEIFDASVHKHRSFYALPYNINPGYSAPIFFELLQEGKMTLLSREALEMRSYNSPYYVGSYSRMVLVNKFFFLDEKGGISSFTGNKRDLLDLMGKKADEVDKYIKANRLDYENKYDFAKIVEYYNSLVGA
jgi:hypothetical protein